MRPGDAGGRRTAHGSLPRRPVRRGGRRKGRRGHVACAAAGDARAVERQPDAARAGAGHVSRCFVAPVCRAGRAAVCGCSNRASFLWRTGCLRSPPLAAAQRELLELLRVSSSRRGRLK